jgi:hypothetical protein
MYNDLQALEATTNDVTCSIRGLQQKCMGFAHAQMSPI